MATTTAKSTVSPQVQSVLNQLRRRIRVFVWIEGLTLVAIWCALLFWVFLAVDYLPILVGATEMPVFARTLYLGVFMGGAAYVLYRWIFRRAFVRLRNESMAVLLERQYGEFHDSLLTSVQLAEHADHAMEFDPSMLSRTSDDALRHLSKVQVGRVMNYGPLARKIFLAVVLVLSVVVFGFAAPKSFALAGKRMLFLSQEGWPRAAQIEILDFPEDSHIRKVALGSDYALRIRARTDREVVPKYCWIYYETDDGDHGRLQALREGQPRDSYQYYVCHEGPFDGVIDSVTFDVLGHDHRLYDYRLQMVKQPSIIHASVRCEYPSYLVDEENGLFLSQTKDVTTGMALEQGTSLTLVMKSNKDLAEAEITVVGEEEPEIVSIGESGRRVPEGENPLRYFEYDLGTLEQPLEVQVLLRDVDEVSSQQPYRVLIGMAEDQPPQIDARLSGIGIAVTPDARIPMQGTIRDDYGVREAWLELVVDGDDMRRYPFSVKQGSISGASIDLRDERSLEEGSLELQPGQTLTLVARASDNFDLSGPDLPNIGTGDRYELEVVTPDDLLRILERRELEMRGRFEQIVEETRLARDMLQRVVSASQGAVPAITLEPGDEVREPGDELETDTAARREELRGVSLLRIQRSIQHCQKAAPEILGVALGFDTICLEIENNRIDAQDRMERLHTQVAIPLKHISEEMLPEWEARLAEVEALLNESQESTAAAEEALAQADEVLAEMERILSGMLNMQDFNEIVDYLREMIDSQQEIRETTSELRREETLRLLDGP